MRNKRLTCMRLITNLSSDRMSMQRYAQTIHDQKSSHVLPSRPRTGSSGPRRLFRLSRSNATGTTRSTHLIGNHPKSFRTESLSREDLERSKHMDFMEKQHDAKGPQKECYDRTYRKVYQLHRLVSLCH